MQTPSKTIIDLERKFWQSIVEQDTDAALDMLCEPALMVSTHGAMKFDHQGYRRMAEDAVDHAIVLGRLDERACVTRNLRIHNPGEHDTSAAWYARHEMARTVEDVLARRTRQLFLNANAALSEAPKIARELAQELGRDEAWQRTQLADFAKVASSYIPPRS